MAEKGVMKKVYYNPLHLASFGGVERLRKGVEDETGKKVSVQDVQDFLAEHRVFVTKPLKQFQADLCDMQALTDHNDGFKYLLTVIDVFSKKAYVHVLKKKTASEVVT